MQWQVKACLATHWGLGYTPNFHADSVAAQIPQCCLDRKSVLASATPHAFSDVCWWIGSESYSRSEDRQTVGSDIIRAYLTVYSAHEQGHGAGTVFERTAAPPQFAVLRWDGPVSPRSLTHSAPHTWRSAGVEQRSASFYPLDCALPFSSRRSLGPSAQEYISSALLPRSIPHSRVEYFIEDLLYTGCVAGKQFADCLCTVKKLLVLQGRCGN